jgi:hypothetical protein
MLPVSGVLPGFGFDIPIGAIAMLKGSAVRIFTI